MPATRFMCGEGCDIRRRGRIAATGTEDDGFFYIAGHGPEDVRSARQLTSIMIRLKNPEDAPLVASKAGNVKGAESSLWRAARHHDEPDGSAQQALSSRLSMDRIVISAMGS